MYLYYCLRILVVLFRKFRWVCCRFWYKYAYFFLTWCINCLTESFKLLNELNFARVNISPRVNVLAKSLYIMAASRGPQEVAESQVLVAVNKVRGKDVQAGSQTYRRPPHT